VEAWIASRCPILKHCHLTFTAVPQVNLYLRDLSQSLDNLSSSKYNPPNKFLHLLADPLQVQKCQCLLDTSNPLLAQYRFALPLQDTIKARPWLPMDILYIQ
jgi:hypothetical protein